MPKWSISSALPTETVSDYIVHEVRTMTTCHQFLLLTVAFLATYSIATVAIAPSSRSICDICACLPDNVAPTTVNCTCSNATRTKVIRSATYYIFNCELPVISNLWQCWKQNQKIKNLQSEHPTFVYKYL